MAFALFAARWVIVYINFVMCAMCNKRDFSFNFQIAALHAVVQNAPQSESMVTNSPEVAGACVICLINILLLPLLLRWVELRCVVQKKTNERFVVSQYLETLISAN